MPKLMEMGRRSLTLLLMMGLLMATLVALPAAPAAANGVSSDRYLHYSNGTQSAGCHVYAEGINWNRSVGVLYYLGGDYASKTPHYSSFHTPEGDDMKVMAQAANARNMVFVSVETPDQTRSGGYYTWWVNGGSNAT